jgi:predicted nucleotidyltransferase component of viral defense system
LISAEDIRRIAREEKLAAGIVEKDYALTWLLKGFYLMDSGLDDRFVLKGGTAIRKVYFPQVWRFSEDLDFTVAKAAKPEGIKDLCNRHLIGFSEKAASTIHLSRSILRKDQ